MKPACPCIRDFHDNHIMASATRGHLHCVLDLLGKGCDADEDSVIAAIEEGHLEIVELLIGYGTGVPDDACDIAAMSGRLEMLQYFISKGYHYDARTLSYAAGEGSIPMIEYLRSLGCDWNHKAILSAGLRKQFKCVEYLIDNGCDLIDEGINIACQVGKYDFFMYIVQKIKELHKPFAWTTESLSQLMFKNDLKAIQYALDKGCPFDERVISQCLHHSTLDSVKLLLEHPRAVIRPEKRSYIENEALRIATHYNLECFKYLINRGFGSYDDSMFKTLQTRIIHKDLDDPFWRSFLFEAHAKKRLYISPPLQEMVNMKKKELEELKKNSSVLYESNKLPKDVVVHTIQRYF